MKKFKLLVLCFAAFIGLSGCHLELPSPDKLIEPPASNEEKIQQKQIISKLLSDEDALTLTVPDNMDDPSAYIVVDIDKDDEREMLAFYANAENIFEQGFVILKEDPNEKDGWYIAQKVSETGDNIDYFKLFDLNKDGQDELLFGLNSWGSKYLYCYGLNNGRWEFLARIQYDMLATNLTAAENQLVASVSDINSNPATSQINVYTLRGDEVAKVYEDTIKGYCKAIVCGQFAPKRQGIGLAMQHNQYYTMVLLLEDAIGYHVELEEPLSYDYANEQEMDIFRDVNNDGIQEICYLLPPSDDAGNHTLKDYLRVWYQWQEDVGLQAVQASFNNSRDGYEFLLPSQWIGRVEYRFSKGQGIEWTDVFLTQDAGGEGVKLFSIAAIDTYTWEQSTNLPKEQITVLGNNPNKKKVYIAMLSQDLPEEMPITENQLIACLRIEGGK